MRRERRVGCPATFDRKCVAGHPLRAVGPRGVPANVGDAAQRVAGVAGCLAPPVAGPPNMGPPSLTPNMPPWTDAAPEQRLVAREVGRVELRLQLRGLVGRDAVVLHRLVDPGQQVRLAGGLVGAVELRLRDLQVPRDARGGREADRELDVAREIVLQICGLVLVELVILEGLSILAFASSRMAFSRIAVEMPSCFAAAAVRSGPDLSPRGRRRARTRPRRRTPARAPTPGSKGRSAFSLPSVSFLGQLRIRACPPESTLRVSRWQRSVTRPGARRAPAPGSPRSCRRSRRRPPRGCRAPRTRGAAPSRRE